MVNQIASTVDPQAKILDISKDFYRYCKNNLKIKDKVGQIIPLVPNKAQREVVDYVLWCLENDQPIRVIVLKARQEGLSTIIEALIYWWTNTHKNVASKIVAHEQGSATKIYRMFERFYEHTLPVFQNTRKFHSRTALYFDKPDGTGLKSEIDTATAENPKSGRGETIQWLHGSEIAFWRDAPELAAGLLNTVALQPKTAIFLESTANGAAGYFYQEWQAAKAGESSFKPFFFPWYIHDEYRIKTAPLKDKTDEELRWQKVYGIDDEQLAWYRWKSKELGRTGGKMKQEYPFNDAEAFLASGRARFDTEKLLAMELQAREPAYYELYQVTDEVKFKKVASGPFKVWKKPEEDRKYIIGVDVAEGLEVGDFSVIDVTDKETLETVARWRGQVEPADLGDLCEMVGTWYNRALIGVEINNHGLTVVQRLRDRRYDNLYRREVKLDERLEETTQRLGWLTNIKTKPLMIDTLAEAIKTNQIKDYDAVFIRECLSYVIDERGKTGAQAGAYDDTVMAKAICLQLFEWSYVTKVRRATTSKLPSKYLASKQRNRKLVKKRNRELSLELW